MTDGLWLSADSLLLIGNTDLHSSGRPSHWLGTPGGSEELTQAYYEYVEESDADTH